MQFEGTLTSISACAPLVGSCLFNGCSFEKVNMTKVAHPMVPFFLVMFLALPLTTYLQFISINLVF
jgi:TRAP-type C4-dicarboxylate transport system permease large subunit